MSKSCLSQKISLCECIETLNDNGCFQVIRLLQHFQEYQYLNQFLIHVIFKITEETNVESLQYINNEIKQIACNNRYLRIDHEQQSANIKLKNAKNCAPIEGKNVIFPLFRLPVDIIKNTSFFLNEQDVFAFEKCCRLFYEMVNNLSYLKQSNNFEYFILNDARFDQMCDAKYSFYKYSQANTLKINVSGLEEVDDETHSSVTQYINKTQSKWETVKYIDKCYDHWLTNLFKSIKSLELCDDTTMWLLDKLPLKILFDPQSHLESLTIDHYWNSEGNFGHLQKAIDEFERQYLELKQNYQQQGKKIKKLQRLVYGDGCSDADERTTGPRYIEAEHLILGGIRNSFPAQRLLSTINVHVLTCNDDFNGSKFHKIDCNIDTLRLIGFVTCYSKTDIVVNDKLIQALNLHRNLVNLTIELVVNPDTNVSQWMKAIEKILSKQHYHNLKNTNILVIASGQDIHNIFHILKENISILKHQFNQLNIGLQIFGAGNNWTKYCTFEWNSQIDEKFLDKKQQEMDGDEMIYNQWLNQWTNENN